MTRVSVRKQIFVGCEGGSERSYAAFLGQLADAAGLRVYLETRDLGGGDAKTCMGRAISEYKKYRRTAGQQVPGFVLLDRDRVDGHLAAIETAAARYSLAIIWQDPCHEALLLRHFAGEENRQPHNCRAAMQHLLNQWPPYTKNMAAKRIAQTLALDHVRRAATVTPALQSLLDKIRL